MKSISWIFLLLLVCLSITAISEARKRSNKAVIDSDEDVPVQQSPTKSSRHKKVEATAEAPASSSSSSSSSSTRKFEDNTIEDVDEDKIDETLRDATKNLVIFFYDGRTKCPGCSEALAEVEEIDDEIEATGYIEVVKTDDRSVARELGVTTFPSLVYFRRKNPITYDGDFKDSEVVLRWLRSHDEVVTWDLTDDNFEEKTNSYAPNEGALDWFVMFYNAEIPDCNAFVSSWETVAHKLRGIINVGKVDGSVNDDVMERFRLDSDQCPVFLFFHRGKMYRYKDAAKDIRGLTTFALHKFKDQRGHRIPEPPTALEQFYEHIKERTLEILDDSQALSIIGVGGLIVIIVITLLAKARRIQAAQAATAEKPKST